MMYDENKALLTGEIVSTLEFSHEIYGEEFYVGKIKISRTSGVQDVLPFMISERLLDIKTLSPGSKVQMLGSIRTFNEHTENGVRLKIFLFVESMDEVIKIIPENDIQLIGYICKKESSRKTPRGRVICDVTLAVNRPYGKSDYIPCIFWGKNAVYMDGLDIGTKIELAGRFQSRAYTKEDEEKTAYEISVQNYKI